MKAFTFQFDIKSDLNNHYVYALEYKTLYSDMFF